MLPMGGVTDGKNFHHIHKVKVSGESYDISG